MKVNLSRYDICGEIDNETYYIDDTHETIWYKNEWYVLYEDQEGCRYFFAEKSTIYPKIILRASKVLDNHIL